MHASYSTAFVGRANYTFHVKFVDRDTGQDAGSERLHAALTRVGIHRG